MPWVEHLLAFLLGGGLIGLLDWFLKRRTNTVEVKRSDVDRLCVLVDHLQEDNDRLRRHLRDIEDRMRSRDVEQEREIMALRMGILILIEQLREMGVTPRWVPCGSTSPMPKEGEA